MINGQYVKTSNVQAAEVQPENEAALIALVGTYANPTPSESDGDQRMMTQRMPVAGDGPLTGVVIPSILPDGSFFRESSGRMREYGRDFYVGAVIVKREVMKPDGTKAFTLDGFATVEAFGEWLTSGE